MFTPSMSPSSMLTQYLEMYHTDAKSFAKKLMNEIAHKTRIPSTVGIGTKPLPCKDRSGYYSQEEQGSHGLPKRGAIPRDPLGSSTYYRLLADRTRHGCKVATFRNRYHAWNCNLPGGCAVQGLRNQCELLIDHAWGRESCLISDIKNI